MELPQNLPAVPLAGLRLLRGSVARIMVLTSLSVVVIIKDVKQNREALPRVKSVVRPPSQPVQEKIYLQYYRNMRRTVRGKLFFFTLNDSRLHKNVCRSREVLWVV